MRLESAFSHPAPTQAATTALVAMAMVSAKNDARLTPGRVKRRIGTAATNGKQRDRKIDRDRLVPRKPQHTQEVRQSQLSAVETDKSTRDPEAYARVQSDTPR